MPMFSTASTGVSVMAALAAAAASFIAADLIVYPKYGNLRAVAADVLISGVVLLEISYLAKAPLSLPGLALLALIIAAGEWYYHGYLSRTLFRRPRR